MPVQAHCKIGWNVVIILNIIPKSLLSGLIQFSILHAADEKGIVLVITVLSAHTTEWITSIVGQTSSSYYLDQKISKYISSEEADHGEYTNDD